MVWVAIAIAYFSPMVLNHSLLVFWGDELEQLLPHMHQFISWIQSGSFSLWNPSIGLGSSSLVGLFISMGSPFTFIAADFPDNWLPYLMIWFDLIRYGVIAYFAYRWLSHHVKSETARLVGTFIITFSGYILCWIHYAPFIDPFMGFMMVLALSEDALRSKNRIWFSLSILFTILVNPYYFYMFSWYLVFYLSYRLLSEKYHGMAFIKKAWSIGSYYLLGVGLSAVILLPAAFILKSAPRISSISFMDLLPSFDFKSWYAIFTAFFSPVINDFSINLFYNYQAPTVDLAIPHVYPLVIGTFLVIPFFNIQFKGKKALSIFAMFIFSMMFVPIFYKIFNGIMDVRWIFMVIFTLVLAIIQTIEYKDQIDHRTWFINAILLIIVLGLITFVSWTKHLYWANASTTLKYHLVFAVLMIVFYTFAFIKSKSNYFYFLIAIALIVETNWILYNRLNTNGSPNYITQETQMDFDSLFQNEEIDWIKAQDKGVYRIDVKDGISTQAASQDFSGFLMYMSTYNFETQSFYDDRLTPMRKLDYTDSKDLLKTILGSKYYVSDQGDLPYGYTSLNKNIAVNSTDIGLGFASSVQFDLKDVQQLDVFLQDVAMYAGVALDDGTSSLDFVKPLELGHQLINGGIDYLYKENGYFIVDFSQSNPYGTCKVDYSKNGEVIKSITKEEYGYASFPMIEDATKMYFYCSFTYNPDDYIPVNIYEVNSSFIDTLYSQLSSMDKFENVINEIDKVTTNIDVTKDQSLAYTTIAYDAGWSVKVDGQKVETLKVNNGFVGFKLDSGKHVIEMNYLPQGMMVGGVISMMSVIILVFLSLKKKGDIK